MEDKRKELVSQIRPVPTYLLERDNLMSQESELSEGENPLNYYMRIGLTYRWLILLVALISFLSATLYSFLATPLYTGEAKVKIGTYTPLLPNANMEDILRQQTREQDYLQTQIELLSSLTLADKVLSDPAIEKPLKDYFERKTGLFSILTPLTQLFSSDQTKTKEPTSSDDYRYPVNTLRQYLSLVSVRPIRKTSLVSISVTTASPELSAQIANVHAQNFIELIRGEHQKSALDSLLFLKTQAAELAEKVALSERNIATYAEDNAIVALNKDENIVVKRLAELSQMLTASTAKRIKSESAFREAKSGSGMVSTTVDDQATQELRRALKEAQAEYAQLSEKFKPEYPRMQQLQAKVDDLKKTLDDQRRQGIKTLEAEYKSDQDAEQKLAKEVEMQKSAAFELSRREVQYNIMKREFDSLKDLHQSVLRQLKEAQVSAEANSSNITIADRAAPPSSHSSPKRLLNIMLSLFLGPVIGIGLGLLLETLDNTIKTPEEVQNLLHLPALGIVPAFNNEDIKTGKDDTSNALLGLAPGSSRHSRLEHKAEDLDKEEEQGDSLEETDDLPNSKGLPNLPAEFVTVTAPRSIAAEAFRAIRTGILLSSADNPPRIILVSSAKKGEGKSTLLSNLGVTLAQSGNLTLLIDADLRRPTLARRLGVPPTNRGLVDYLSGQTDLNDIISETAVANLDLISSGPKPPNPAELLGSRKMSEMLQLLKEGYDYILIDSPPVMPVTDAVMLSRIVDGTVLVVRGMDTQKQVAKEAAAKLRQVNARVLGVVLNDVNVRSGQYYYYYRDTYADYYAEDKEPAQKRKKAFG